MLPPPSPHPDATHATASRCSRSRAVPVHSRLRAVGEQLQTRDVPERWLASSTRPGTPLPRLGPRHLRQHPATEPRDKAPRQWPDSSQGKTLLIVRELLDLESKGTTLRESEPPAA